MAEIPPPLPSLRELFFSAYSIARDLPERNNIIVENGGEIQPLGEFD